LISTCKSDFIEKSKPSGLLKCYIFVSLLSLSLLLLLIFLIL